MHDELFKDGELYLRHKEINQLSTLAVKIEEMSRLISCPYLPHSGTPGCDRCHYESECWADVDYDLEYPDGFNNFEH